MRRARDTPVAANSFVRSERSPQSQAVAVLIFLKPVARYLFLNCLPVLLGVIRPPIGQM